MPKNSRPWKLNCMFRTVFAIIILTYIITISPSNDSTSSFTDGVDYAVPPLHRLHPCKGANTLTRYISLSSFLICVFNLPVKPRLHTFKSHMMYTLYGHQIQNVIQRGTYCSEFDVFLTLSAFQRTKLNEYSVYSYLRGLDRVSNDKLAFFSNNGLRLK